MARYQSGDLVAFENKFERCGRIVRIDNRGYKIDTGYDVIYAYEGEIVRISGDAPIRPTSVMEKMDQAGSSLPQYTPDFRDGLASFIRDNSEIAKLFASYAGSVSNRVLTTCLEAISNIKIEKIEVNIIKIEISEEVARKIFPVS
jgi:hypothetical protein